MTEPKGRGEAPVPIRYSDLWILSSFGLLRVCVYLRPKQFSRRIRVRGLPGQGRRLGRNRAEAHDELDAFRHRHIQLRHLAFPGQNQEAAGWIRCGWDEYIEDF